ncbi:tRNA (guanine-N(7)-)-methyltransferase [Smittium mucronatum]|uniref:tRNA (guanine-N(7)-)-methyltransferase n=1 Tax=Smittium mucronatum TaxID=133383 RepID=A0A1R0GV39_9FUNG|nr:tRNA (guanine-N(7)-)-methyltransferase [Smittium mucronatum]
MDWSHLYPTYFRTQTETLQSVVPSADSTIAAESVLSKRALDATADPTPGKVHIGELGPSTTTVTNFSQPDTLAQIEFADIGCGYGGLLVALAPLFPNTLMLGMEIRTKLVNYVQKRINVLRHIQDNLANETSAEFAATTPDDHEEAEEEEEDDDEDRLNEDEKKQVLETGETKQLVNGRYKNIAVIRMNAMKYLPNFFKKGQLSKIFFLFPDPHFKKRKHKARIISETLVSEYAYATRIGGILYTVTDVHDLHLWMKQHLDAHPLFERIPDNELVGSDPVIEAVYNCTEEGRKVTRNNGQKYLACYRRIRDPYSPPIFS